MRLTIEIEKCMNSRIIGKFLKTFDIKAAPI